MSPIARSSPGKLGLLLLTLLFIEGTSRALEWKTPPAKITLLAVNAHPDDEGIFFGGALPYYSGVLQIPTMLLSMTSGDWNTNNLLIRENELRHAAWIYGLRYEPLFPRFRDVPSQTMAGNPYANKIDATWDYWADGILQGDGSDVAKGRARAVNYVAEVIRRYRPDVVITHDVNGEYGHDNHKATSLVVTEAYSVAADPTASATNLAGLAPWQVRKLYVHLYKTNQLFHTEWETPRDEFGGKTARQVANDGLDAHVSQNMPDVSTFYLSNENYNGHDSERWGLFASTVGWDSVGTNGTAVGTFLENLNLTNEVNRPPEFFPKPIPVAPAVANKTYEGQTLARFATDLDKVAGDVLGFSKISGPSWLTVAPNGTLSGIPTPDDVGENLFTVKVTDSAGAFDEAPLRIFVGGRLAAAWNCNEGTGSVVRDDSGEGHHATLTSSNGWMPGRDKSALNLDGTSSFAAASDLTTGNTITVAAWICSSNLVGEHAIFSEGSGYTLKTSGTTVRFTTPGIRDHSLAANLVTGQWYHVAVTFDAGSANGCKFYINGQFRGAVNASARNVTGGPSWIGRNYWGQHFSGLLDDIRVYRELLQPAEIAALYANRPPTFTLDPIIFPGVLEESSYTGETLSGRAQDPDDSDVLTFRKITGPEWLNVGTSGALYGVPHRADVGTNIFQVQVSDNHGATARASLRIVVAYQPTFQLSVANFDEGRPNLVFTAHRLQNYQILGSSNLVTWELLAPFSTDASGRGSWKDPILRTNSFFYRVQQ